MQLLMSQRSSVAVGDKHVVNDRRSLPTTVALLIVARPNETIINYFTHILYTQVIYGTYTETTATLHTLSCL